MHNLRSELSASVFRVLVEDGQRIRSGDEVIVLESMKMEIPVVSDVDGLVSEILVKEGDIVEEGDVVVKVSQ